MRTTVSREFTDVKYPLTKVHDGMGDRAFSLVAVLLVNFKWIQSFLRFVKEGM